MRLDRHLHPFAPSVTLRHDRHPYAHGGGFGLSTEILANFSLANVLKDLEPHRFAQCDRILHQHKRVLNAASARKITLSMENSPVVAALSQIKFGPIPLEWDLWLDAKEPHSPDKALIEHGSVLASLFGKLPFTRKYFLKSAPSVSTWLRIYNQAITRFSALTARKIETMPPLCLDIKSSWSTAKDINLFVQTLKNTFQIDVRYVGSFTYSQIASISGPEAILFCHAVHDLQQQVESGYFPKSIMLNGADLEDSANLGTLRAIARKHPGVNIGIYVQEPEAGTDAVQRLITMVNTEPELFRLGFALGNSRDGRAPRMIVGSGAGMQKLLLTNSPLLKMKRAIAKIVSWLVGFISWLFSWKRTSARRHCQ